MKDAAALRNLYTILQSRLQTNKLIVVSAMGKTTNALEAVLAKKLEQADFSQDWNVTGIVGLVSARLTVTTTDKVGYAATKTVDFQLTD